MVKDGLEFNLFFKNRQTRVIALQPFNKSFQMKDISIENKQVGILLYLSIIDYENHLRNKKNVSSSYVNKGMLEYLLYSTLFKLVFSIGLKNRLSITYL